MEQRYTSSGDRSSSNQVVCACTDFWELWEEVRPLLVREPAKIRLPGQSRPVVMPEPVALEDAVDGAVRLVEHWRGVLRLDQHLTPWPELRRLLPHVAAALRAPERGWPRRRTVTAEQVLALLWDPDQRKIDMPRTVRRWRGAFDNFLRVDLLLATCEDCGRDIFRRRSEPAAPLLCALCRERRLSDSLLRLEGWLPAQ